MSTGWSGFFQDRNSTVLSGGITLRFNLFGGAGMLSGKIMVTIVSSHKWWSCLVSTNFLSHTCQKADNSVTGCLLKTNRCQLSSTKRRACPELFCIRGLRDVGVHKRMDGFVEIRLEPQGLRKSTPPPPGCWWVRYGAEASRSARRVPRGSRGEPEDASRGPPGVPTPAAILATRQADASSFSIQLHLGLGAYPRPQTLRPLPAVPHPFRPDSFSP